MRAGMHGVGVVRISVVRKVVVSVLAASCFLRQDPISRCMHSFTIV